MFPRIIFSDFDGTLTYGLSLGSFFFHILELIQSKKSEMVIVTGRPASWGHFLMTHTPVSAVISEGGGLLTQMNQGIIFDHALVPESELKRLSDFTEKFLQQFPALKLSADSAGRVSDRAVELDVARPIMKELEKYFDAHNIHYSCSSVHLNFWAGENDKYTAMQNYLKEHRPEVSMDECIYFGDSLNDQSVFKSMKNTVGVSNIREVLDKLEHKPNVVLVGEHNQGPAGVLNYLDYLSRK